MTIHTKVASPDLEAYELYQCDHQDVQSHCPCRNRNPICEQSTLSFTPNIRGINKMKSTSLQFKELVDYTFLKGYF